MSQLFSKKNKEVFSAPLGMNNPVTVQVLGICSALAVTAKLEPAIVMGLSVTVITAFSNVVISLLRKTIPNRIRIIVQLVVVAALVTIVSEVLKAFAYDVSVQLSVYVGLIITNCILMGRLEAFAMQNAPWESFLDGIGNGLGYAKILIIVAFFRELLGSGTLLGWSIRDMIVYIFNDKLHFNLNLPENWVYEHGYLNNGLMLMPPMALIICACIIWYQRAKHKELQEN
ncbi:NADH:ubiquinone reductase (Na(+)-transporting) subunit D [Bacteroides sp.]